MFCGRAVLLILNAGLRLFDLSRQNSVVLDRFEDAHENEPIFHFVGFLRPQRRHEPESRHLQSPGELLRDQRLCAPEIEVGQLMNDGLQPLFKVIHRFTAFVDLRAD